MAEGSTNESLRDTWTKRLAAEEKAHGDFRKLAKEASDAYRPTKIDQQPAFPIWWSIVQILKAALYARSPKPDVRKRYADDPTQQQAPEQAQVPPGAPPGAPMPQAPAPPSGDRLATVIERALSFCMDVDDFDGPANRAVRGFLVAALGVTKVELETESTQVETPDPINPGQQLVDPMTGKPVFETVIVKQTVRHVNFSWRRFRWQPAKAWELVRWVSYDHVLSKEDVETRWKGKKIKDDAAQIRDQTEAEKAEAGYLVHEIWDLDSNRRIFIGECCEGVLEAEPLPMKLQSRFPSPRPMMTGVSDEELIPETDYSKIQSQCDQVDKLTRRLRALTRGVKDVGFYDAGMPELATLMDAEDMQLLPVDNLLARLEQVPGGRGTFASVMAMQDNVPKTAVIRELQAQLEREKQTLFETVGIADIIRGVSDPREPLGTQELKGGWANVRVSDKQNEVNRYFRDMFRIESEVLAEHVDKKQLERMSGMQLTDEEYATLKSDLGRVYVIDIETDSTLAQDEQAMRKDTLELLKVVTDYLNTLLPLVSSGQLPAGMAKEMLLMVVRTYKSGRQLEDEINQLPATMQQLQGLQQSLQQCQQELAQCQKALQETQGELAKVDQGKEARENATAQADIQGKNAEAVKDASTAELNRQRAAQEAQAPMLALVQ